jgi:hypothetical protein
MYVITSLILLSCPEIISYINTSVAATLNFTTTLLCAWVYNDEQGQGRVWGGVAGPTEEGNEEYVNIVL